MRSMIPKQNQFEKASRETNEQIEYKQENTSSLSPGVSPWSGYSVLYRLIYYYHVSIINKWIWDYASWVRRRPHVIPCHTAPCLCDTEQVRCGRRLALHILRFSLFWSFLFSFILRFVFKGLSFILLRWAIVSFFSLASFERGER